jgi:hypothetical protein
MYKKGRITRIALQLRKKRFIYHSHLRRFIKDKIEDVKLLDNT